MATSGGSPGQPKLAYRPELDGLRAVAALLVLLFHCGPDGAFSGGFIGVDIFFVLSAWLITGILVAERERFGAIRLGRFYWRRALRLMPALVLLLAVYVAVAPLVWPEHAHGRDALLALFYAGDYSYPFYGAPFYLQHSWSLAIEEQFYLLWPLLLVVLLRHRDPLPWLWGAWAALTLWRISCGDDWRLYYYRFDTHGTGLVMGAILYFTVKQGRGAFGPLHAVAAALLLAMLTATAEIDNSVLTISAAEFGAANLVGALAGLSRGGWVGQGLASPPLVALGKLSYGLYLWHFPIAYYLRDRLDYAPTIAVTFALSLAAATFSYWTVEAWARRLKASEPRIAAPALPA